MCGVLGVSEEEFYNTTPKFFFSRLTGFYQHIEETEKLQWVRSRWLALLTIQPHVKKRLKENDLGVFAWEKHNEIKPEDVDRIKQRFKKLLNGA